MGARRPRRSPRVAKAAPERATLFDLTGRVALVTGASRGLGAAMSEAFAQAGADLILWARGKRALQRQAKKLSVFGSRVVAQPVDVTNHRTVRRAVDAALKQFGQIDILLNNAGIWSGDPALKFDRPAWDEVIESNLTAVFFVSQTVAPAMAKRRYGKIINVSSTSGVRAHEQGAAYGSSKAALIHLTKILAVEWGPVGIRVTSIAPGLFRTDMTREEFADRAWLDRRRAAIPLRKFGEPEELGGLAVFLASGASDHITGQTIIIDGGASLTT